MAFRFTDSHATSLVASFLTPGEHILFRARGVEKPWYSQIFWRVGALFWKNWLVVGTNQRLLFVQHGGLLSGYKAKRTEAYAWGELDAVGLGWGIFNKTLRVRSKHKRLSRGVQLGRWWMKGNFDAASGIVTTWRSRGALGPGPVAAGALAA